MRRTKEIVRNIARIKEMQGFTTQQLADRCNEFLGEPGKIKLSTLNGLLAGKRRTISATELEMLSAALDVPLLGLLYLPQEKEVEIRPGVKVRPEYGIRHAASIWNFYDGDSPLDLERSFDSKHDPVSYGVYRIVNAWFLRWDFYEAMVYVFELIEKDADEESLRHVANSAVPAITAYQQARDWIRTLGIAPEPLPSYYAWVDSIPAKNFNIDIAKANLEGFQASRAATQPEVVESATLDRKWLTALRGKNNGSPA